MLIDAIVLKVRDGQVANRPVYVAMGITVDCERDVLGMWIGPTGGEGAKQWMGMLTELGNRGVADVCTVCCDGLRGLPEAITAIWPLATVQTCVVHMVRNSLRYASKADWGRSPDSLRRSTPPRRWPQPSSVSSTSRRPGREVSGDDRDVGTVLAGVHSVPAVPG